jgi:hypothetical protein
MPACLPALPIKHYLPVWWWRGSVFGRNLNLELHSGLLPTKPSSSPHKAVQLSAQCGRTKAIGEFCGPTYCPARAQRAAIWLDRCTAPALHSADGIFCKLRPSLLHPIRSAHTNQQSACSASTPNPCSWGRIRLVDKVSVPISDETTRGRTYASSLDRRLQRMGAKNLQDRNIAYRARQPHPLPYHHHPRFGETYDDSVAGLAVFDH